MKKNKIALLINSLGGGGAEKVISVVIIELIKRGHEVELIFLEKNIFYEIPSKVKITYLTNFNGRENGIKKLLYIPILAWRLNKYIKREGINKIQSHLYRANYVNILSKVFGSKHDVQIVNTGTISKYYDEGLVGKVNLFLIKILYPKANLIIAKSRGMLVDMQSLFHFNNEIIVLNNPYDIDEIHRLQKENVSDFSFDCNKKYIISVGRFETFKRQDCIIEALNKLPNEYELILLGDGHKKETLKSLVSMLEIKDRVHFLGRVLNPYKYMDKSDIFVLSSANGEGFPNVLVEAMICKIPVISSDCLSGPREILAPNSDIHNKIKNNIEKCDSGILFPVGNVEMLVEAILLLNDESIKSSNIKNAELRCADLSVEKIVNQYVKILEIE